MQTLYQIDTDLLQFPSLLWREVIIIEYPLERVFKFLHLRAGFISIKDCEFQFMGDTAVGMISLILLMSPPFWPSIMVAPSKFAQARQGPEAAAFSCSKVKSTALMHLKTPTVFALSSGTVSMSRVMGQQSRSICHK